MLFYTSKYVLQREKSLVLLHIVLYVALVLRSDPFIEKDNQKVAIENKGQYKSASYQLFTPKIDTQKRDKKTDNFLIELKNKTIFYTDVTTKNNGTKQPDSNCTSTRAFNK